MRKSIMISCILIASIALSGWVFHKCTPGETLVTKQATILEDGEKTSYCKKCEEIIEVSSFEHPNKLGDNPIELEAAKYIQEITEIDDVTKINAIVCISNEVSGESNIPGYVIFYSTKSKSDVAYFYRGEYKGNGYNEKYLPNGSNLLSLWAAATTLEFIDDNRLSESTCKRFYEVEEGKDCIAYINLVDIEEWVDNY